MKRKILILGIVAVLFAMLFFLTGCGSSFESKIINKSFSREITGYNDVYLAPETFIFKGNGKGVVKNEDSKSSQNTETNITYDLDEKNNTISVHYENGKNTIFSYSEDLDCITITNKPDGNYQYFNK